MKRLFSHLTTYWMRSPVGGLLHMGVVKLSPIHRQLHAFEVQNMMAYYNNWNAPRRWPIMRFYAWLWTYLISGFRLLCLSPLARQDYYAINRQSPYASKVIPMIADLLLQQTEKFISPDPQGIQDAAQIAIDEAQASLCPKHGICDDEHLPILVVPGLNTPPYFFREMVAHFKAQGYPIYVADMPNKGLGSLEESARSVNAQINALREHYNVDRIHVVGHCLGGLVSKYIIDHIWEVSKETSPIKTLVTLGTGYMGADGVQRLKDYWIPRNPDKPIPVVFDQLIKAQHDIVKRSVNVAYHSIMTVWDFLIPFQNGVLKFDSKTPVVQSAQIDTTHESIIFDSSAAPALDTEPDHPECEVHNHLMEDWKVDHLTLALNPSALQKIQECLERSTDSAA